MLAITQRLAFSPARIAAYEKASFSFKDDMLLTAGSSILQLQASIEYDIAYFHLWKLKWKPKAAAHLGSKAADDDNDVAPAGSN